MGRQESEMAMVQPSSSGVILDRDSNPGPEQVSAGSSSKRARARQEYLTNVRIGYAATGGGIRSAVLNAGILDAMSKEPLPEPLRKRCPEGASAVDLVSDFASVSGGGFVTISQLVALTEKLDRAGGSKEEVDGDAPMLLHRAAIAETVDRLATRPDFLFSGAHGVMYILSMVFNILVAVVRFGVSWPVTLAETLNAVWGEAIRDAVCTNDAGVCIVSPDTNLALLFSELASAVSLILLALLFLWILSRVVTGKLGYGKSDSLVAGEREKFVRWEPLSHAIDGAVKFLLVVAGVCYVVLFLCFLVVAWDSETYQRDGIYPDYTFWSFLAVLVCFYMVVSTGDLVSAIAGALSQVLPLAIVYWWARVAAYRVAGVGTEPFLSGHFDYWKAYLIFTFAFTVVDVLAYTLMKSPVPAFWRKALAARFFPSGRPGAAGSLFRNYDPDVQLVSQQLARYGNARGRDLRYHCNVTLNDWRRAGDKYEFSWFFFELGDNGGSARLGCTKFHGVPTERSAEWPEVPRGTPISKLMGLSSAVVTQSAGRRTESFRRHWIEQSLLNASMSQEISARAAPAWWRSAFSWFGVPQETLANIVVLGPSLVMFGLAFVYFQPESEASVEPTERWLVVCGFATMVAVYVLSFFGAALPTLAGWTLWSPLVTDLHRALGHELVSADVRTNPVLASRGRPPLLYTSDGGHSENMSLIPLFRQRCHVIICGDGEADATYNQDDLKISIGVVMEDIARNGSRDFHVKSLSLGKLTADVYRRRWQHRLRKDEDLDLLPVIGDVSRDWLEAARVGLEHQEQPVDPLPERDINEPLPFHYDMLHIEVVYTVDAEHPELGEQTGDVFLAKPLARSAASNDPFVAWGCLKLGRENFPQTSTALQMYSRDLARRYMAEGGLAWNRVKHAFFQKVEEMASKMQQEEKRQQ